MLQARLNHRAALPQLRQDQIPALAAVAFNEAGIRLDDSKLDFLQARLLPRVMDSQAGSFRIYAERLTHDPEERQKFIESLTVHTTSFFRDRSQYNWLLNSALPELSQHRANISLWSAACSTGQEGWTSLMVAEHYRRTCGRSFTHRLIGTDISTAVLKHAARAVYQADDIDTIEPEYRKSYLLQARNRDGRYRICPSLRSNAEWRLGNLATGAGLQGIAVDVAFLRNVLIYFDSQTQKEVVNRVVNGIRPGGYLLTGHSETGFKHPNLVAVQPSIFQKVKSP